ATVTALLEQGHTARLLSPDAEATVRRWPHGVEAAVGDVAASRHPQGTADGCQAVLHLAAVREPWATTAKTGAASRASGPSRIDVRGTRWLVAEAECAGSAASCRSCARASSTRPVKARWPRWPPCCARCPRCRWSTAAGWSSSR